MNLLAKIKTLGFRNYTRLKVAKQIFDYNLNINSIYSFGIDDLNLYISELFTEMPPIYLLDICEDSKFVLLRIGNVEFYWPSELDRSDLPWLWHEIFDPWQTNPSSYNNPKFESVDKLDWVIDAGASEGFYSLFASQNFDGHLIAIEPIPTLQSSLMKTLKMHRHKNRLNFNFQVVGKALACSTGVAKIRYSMDSVCCAEIESSESEIVNSYVDESKQPNKPVTHELEVELTSLDILSKQFGLDGKGLIKMDIEGFEMQALMGAKSFLSAYKPLLAIAVYHDYNNALECARIIKDIRDDYEVELRGFYGYFKPPRPYILFAY
jgi:FkbM family methyltransferase